jgi:small multidrug resistance family-3 protein
MCQQDPIMRNGFFILAALLELAGCYFIWWGQRQASWPLLVLGIAVLAGFGLSLAQVSGDLPSRAYAAYGAIYICAALAWMMLVDKHAPDRWDVTGVVISLAGAAVILFGPRG